MTFSISRVPDSSRLLAKQSFEEKKARSGHRGYFFLPFVRLITKNGYVHPLLLESQTGTAWNRVKTRPTSHHAIDWPKAYRTRLVAHFRGTMTRRCKCRRLIICLDVSRFSRGGSRPGGFRVPKPRKSLVVESVCFYTWSQCVPVLFPVLVIVQKS